MLSLPLLSLKNKGTYLVSRAGRRLCSLLTPGTKTAQGGGAVHLQTCLKSSTWPSHPPSLFPSRPYTWLIAHRPHPSCVWMSSGGAGTGTREGKQWVVTRPGVCWGCVCVCVCVCVRARMFPKLLACLLPRPLPHAPCYGREGSMYHVVSGALLIRTSSTC